MRLTLRERVRRGVGCVAVAVARLGFRLQRHRVSVVVGVVERDERVVDALQHEVEVLRLRVRAGRLDDPQLPPARVALLRLLGLAQAQAQAQGSGSGLRLRAQAQGNSSGEN